MCSESLKRVLEFIREENANEAQLIFNKIEPVESVEYYMVMGKIEQKFQNWGKAINAYSKVLEIEPENVEAQNHLHLIQNILNFWNPEMFNP